MNKLISSHLILYKDIWIKIFSYLSAKDIISCSRVNHKFYEASSDNHIWFELFRNEGYKFMKNPNMIVYEDKINYKLYHLSYFNQKYHLQTFNFYREIQMMASLGRNGLEKSIIYGLYIPGAIIFLPLIVGMEIYECISHHRKKYEYCSCNSCYKILYMKVNSKYRITK
jgi:hypothetical protein